MKTLIDINNYPVSVVLKTLVKDKTTGQNIILATTARSKRGRVFGKTKQITEELLQSIGTDLIQPRVAKSLEKQAERTREKAEVFTPSWICNKMNNHCDAEWFGRENVFNTEDGQSWKPTSKQIKFENENDWQKYVDSKRLEITCGEAPYIVSRYDTTTAEIIPIKRRIGILDRKLRVVNENTDNEGDWLKWVYRAFQSVYGYEFQGDNLLIARINLLITFLDYMQDRWARNPTESELQKVANIIAWNIWQMDGITGKVPFGKPKEERTLNMFDFTVGNNDNEPEEMDCKIFDWTRRRSYTYRSIKEGR
ncbi:hypothetical protein [Fibrobacter sp.]|uniref:hypothetical protein n=1 Tax=Fibrobacter sp. TaxID=35828 RepID=UPI0025C1B8BA|nr:hypothetical protein [Fibrobacter sp.]MCI6438244.1 hypothetical protein [Fibrobacter sp.]